MRAEEVISFMQDVEGLKRVPREGWLARGIREPESVAEHTLGVAFLAMLLARDRALDEEKAVEMALLHDLPESRVGDISIFSPKYKEKDKIEEEAARVIMGKSPEYALWAEYMEGKTAEAVAVKEADKLELLFQALEYERMGHNVEDFWGEEYAFQGLAKEIYLRLKRSRPSHKGRMKTE